MQRAQLFLLGSCAAGIGVRWTPARYRIVTSPIIGAVKLTPGGDKVGLTSLEMESTDGRFTLVAHTRKALLDVVDEVCALL